MPIITFIVGVVAGLALLVTVTGGGQQRAAMIVPGSIGAPVVGEFRLSPGNLEPLGVVVKAPEPAAKADLAYGSIANPVPGEFRLEPGNAQRAGVAIPAYGSIHQPAAHEFRLQPGNLPRQ